MIEIDKSFGLDDVVSLIDNDEAFAFARYGDGEWNAILDLKGPHQANINGENNYFDSLREALRSVLIRKPSYILGLQGLANRTQSDKIQHFLDSNGLSFDWVNSDVFHHASIKGSLQPFVDCLKDKKVILVGPKYFQKFGLFPIDIYEVPAKNAWLEYDRILQDLMGMVPRKSGMYIRPPYPDKIVFLFACGMTSNVLIHNLWTFNNYYTYIDIGSLFDPYCGVHSRSYHKDLKL